RLLDRPLSRAMTEQVSSQIRQIVHRIRAAKRHAPFDRDAVYREGGAIDGKKRGADGHLEMLRLATRGGDGLEPLGRTRDRDAELGAVELIEIVRPVGPSDVG